VFDTAARQRAQTTSGPAPSARRREILDAAARLFAEHGYAATSVRQISAAVGLGAGALYHHIGSKEDLLADIHEEFVGAIVGELREIVGADGEPREALFAAGRLMTRYLARYREHMTAFFSEYRHIRGERFAEVTRRREEFEALIEELVRRAAPGLEERKLRLSVLALLGTFNYGHVWFSPEGPSTPDEIAERFIALFLDGLDAG
jgi:AcrR family transcriptional regulator